MSSSPERIRTLTDNQPPGSQDGRKRFTPDDPFGDLFSDETAKTADAKEGSPRRSGGSRRRESAAAKQGKRSLLVVLVLVVVVAVSAAVVWFGFGSQLRSLFGGGASSADFEGSGNGTEMAFTIESGDTGTSIGERLAEVGIVKTSGAFVDEVLAQPEDPVFIPGSYGMQEEMSAESALASLLDPENRQESTVVIPEGTALQDVYALIEGGIGIPVAELEAAAIPANFGLPAEATTLEGFLFPATYSFDPGVDATTVLKTLVDRMFQSLDEHGVAPEARWDTIRSRFAHPEGSWPPRGLLQGVEGLPQPTRHGHAPAVRCDGRLWHGKHAPRLDERRGACRRSERLQHVRASGNGRGAHLQPRRHCDRRRRQPS